MRVCWEHVNFEPVIRLPTAWSSVSGNFVVHLFEGTVTIAEMDRMQQIGDAHNARHPVKRVELVVIHSSDARMTGDERTRMARLIEHGDSHRTATATAILAEGERLPGQVRSDASSASSARNHAC